MSEPNAKGFEENPSQFLENAIKQYVATSLGNRLPSFNNEPIFDEPLIGFADGYDPIFGDYKSIIGDFHLTPREVLALYLRNKGIEDEKQWLYVSVIAFVLPITYNTRLTLRRETHVPSLRWNHTRWQGQDFIWELSRYVAGLLEKFSYHAVVPQLENFFEEKELHDGRTSNWSQRHATYAAGLGTFSLSDGFITPKGVAVRCGSVVTNLELSPSPRTYENHLSNCLFHRDRSCRRCIERCPAGAISEQGHDKIMCRDFSNNEQPIILKALGKDKDGYIDMCLDCCRNKWQNLIDQ